MKCNNTINFLLILLIITTSFGLEWKGLNSPSPRRNGMMIVDSLNQRIILFGGDFAHEQWFNDVWTIPLDTTQGYFWRKLSVSGTLPPGRSDHSVIYDPGHNRMIIFGGLGSGNIYNDVWALNLTLGNESWELLHPSGTLPSPRLDHYCVYYPERNSMIVFGGAGNYTRFDDVWELNLVDLTWREISVPGTKPTGRSGGGAMLDRVNQRMIIFGGSSLSNYYNEVWALNRASDDVSWTQLFPTGNTPAERGDIAFGSDQSRNTFYCFGGGGSSQTYNDLYALDLNALTWTRISPTGELPPSSVDPCGIYDYFNDNFLVFGGIASGSYSNATYYIYFGTLDLTEWQSTPQLSSNPAISIKAIVSGPVRIGYTLPNVDNINVKIMDTNGRLVKNLFSGRAKSQNDWLYWDLKDNKGQTVSSGVYYCLLETEDTNISKKFVVAK
jgi:hypothetical protein